MFLDSRALVLPLMLSMSLGFAGGALATTASTHDHGESHHELQLNAGEKWATDAPLRQAMGKVNTTLHDALPAIHENTLADSGYAKLSEQVNAQVAYMVENCALPPAADAQLHVIIASMLAGAEVMASDTATDNRRNGAIKVLGALNDYAQYFDDPGFEPISH